MGKVKGIAITFTAGMIIMMFLAFLAHAEVAEKNIDVALDSSAENEITCRVCNNDASECSDIFVKSKQTELDATALLLDTFLVLMKNKASKITVDCSYKNPIMGAKGYHSVLEIKR